MVAVRQTLSSMGRVDCSIWKSGECRTKPRLVSTGPPISTCMAPTFCGSRIRSISGTISSCTSRSGMFTFAAGRLRMIPIAPSAEWAQM